MKAKKAAALLKTMDRLAARQGETAQRTWLESADRHDLVLAAGTRAAKAARGRYDEATIGVNPVKVAKMVRRELVRQAAEPNPFAVYLARKAASGDRVAADLLDRIGGAPASEVREYAERLAKGSQSGEARQRAQTLLEDLDDRAYAEHHRQQALRKEGRQK